MAALPAALAIAIFPFGVFAQEEQELRGEAIMKHPIGPLAVQVAELMAAGKTEQAIALRSKAAQAEWKSAPTDEKEAMAGLMKQRAPAPAALREAIRKGGVLTLRENFAQLIAPMGPQEEALAMFELEEGKWRASAGPMVMAGSSNPANEVRIQGAEILEHPIGELALKYSDLLHAGKMDEVMKLATEKAQAEWKAAPASERAESTDYRKKTTPKRAELAAAIDAGGVLIIQDDALAGLNIIVIDQSSTGPGQMSSTSTTTSIGFRKEKGEWRLNQ
jgi:hypothetical protein